MRWPSWRLSEVILAQQQEALFDFFRLPTHALTPEHSTLAFWAFRSASNDTWLVGWVRLMVETTWETAQERVNKNDMRIMGDLGRTYSAVWASGLGKGCFSHVLVLIWRCSQLCFRTLTFWIIFGFALGRFCTHYFLNEVGKACIYSNEWESVTWWAFNHCNYAWDFAITSIKATCHSCQNLNSCLE